MLRLLLKVDKKGVNATLVVNPCYLYLPMEVDCTSLIGESDAQQHLTNTKGSYNGNQETHKHLIDNNKLLEKRN